MKYIANPVVVDAQIIIGVGPVESDGTMALALQNGKGVRATRGMLARIIPSEGDYWVTQVDDGYTYLNPKAVFERKYRCVEGTAV